MKCEHCKKQEANFHYSSNVNGTVMRRHLCADCAEALGLAPTQTPDPFLSVLGNFWAPRQSFSALRGTACPLCGATHRSVAETGKAGCAQCYTVLDEVLGAYVRRIHGDAAHKGRIPAGAGTALRLRRETERLRGELKAAVDRQDYEAAADLRDRIRALEGGGVS